MKRKNLILITILVFNYSFSQSNEDKILTLTDLRQELIGKEFQSGGDFTEIWECSDVDRKKSKYGDFDYFIYLTNGDRTKDVRFSLSYNKKWYSFPDNLRTIKEFNFLKWAFPDSYKDIILKDVKVGMSETEVTYCIGSPERKNNSSRGTSQWVYDRYSTGYNYVYFKNGKVTSWTSTSY